MQLSGHGHRGFTLARRACFEQTLGEMSTMAATIPAPEQTSGFSSPQEEALLNLFRTADALEHALQQRLKPFGITGPQYNVLRILRRATPAGLMCSAIGRMMITPEPDITRLLARLKAHKLITQRRDASDGRVVLTHLSQRGMETLAELDGPIGQAPADLLRALSAQELHELTRLLIKARCCTGNGAGLTQEDATQAAVTGHPPSPHSPRSSLPRHHPE